MVSRQRFSTSSFLSLLLLALAFGATLVWVVSGSRSATESEFRAKEARYQSQIKSLKLALQSNSNEFDRERGLAARLQRELQDAHRQIDDLGRQLGTAQRTISEKNEQLRKARLLQGASRSDGRPKHAQLETTSALIVSRATSGLSLPETAKRIERTVSRYSPSKQKRARRDARRGALVAAKTKRRPLASGQQKAVRQIRVYSVGSVAAVGRPAQPRKWPLSTQVASRTNTAASTGREGRVVNRTIVPPVTAVPAVRKPRVRQANRARRVAVARRRSTRRAKYARYSRLGRLNAQRKRKVVRRYRKPRRSYFERLARSGGFGDGYQH